MIWIIFGGLALFILGFVTGAIHSAYSEFKRSIRHNGGQIPFTFECEYCKTPNKVVMDYSEAFGMKKE